MYNETAGLLDSVTVEVQQVIETLRGRGNFHKFLVLLLVATVTAAAASLLTFGTVGDADSIARDFAGCKTINCSLPACGCPALYRRNTGLAFLTFAYYRIVYPVVVPVGLVFLTVVVALNNRTLWLYTVHMLVFTLAELASVALLVYVVVTEVSDCGNVPYCSSDPSVPGSPMAWWYLIWLVPLFAQVTIQLALLMTVRSMKGLVLIISRSLTIGQARELNALSYATAPRSSQPGESPQHLTESASMVLSQPSFGAGLDLDYT